MMLLRRITQHVKNQNWFAIFLDFIIVVAGVFIGIQVSNWNEERVQAKKEHEILLAILGDLKSDRDLLEAGLDMAQLNIDASNYVLSHSGYEPVKQMVLPVVSKNIAITQNVIEVEFSHELTEEQKNQLWKLMTLRFFPTRSNAAFNTLMSSGNLTMISDTELVNELQGYEFIWRALEVSHDSTYRPFRNRTVFVGQEYGLSPFIKIPEDEFFILIRENPKLKSAMTTLMEYSVLHQQQLRHARQIAKSLIMKIEEKIN